MAVESFERGRPPATGDGTEFDDALLGLPGFRVLAVTETAMSCSSASRRSAERPGVQLAG